MIKKPKIITDWENAFPKVCFNCANYTDSGECREYKMKPPAEFMETPSCDEWLEGIPF